MTAGQLRVRFADTALEYLGRCERDRSHTEIIDKYNSFRPLPRGRELNRWGNWNTAFVSVVAADCALGRIIPPECSVEEMVRAFTAKGRYEAAGITPDIGDIVVFKRDDEGICDRLGIIYEQDGKALTVIEGDKDGAVDFCVLDKEGTEIIGYCCPDFREAAKQEDKQND